MKPPSRACEDDAPYVFVSYAHADRDLVFPEIEHLHRLGYRIWYDEGIRPSSEWTDVLAEKIEGCTTFLVFVTPRAVESRHVRNEINWALDRSRQFLAVHLEPTDLPRSLGFQMSSMQAVMAHAMTPEDCRQRIREALPRQLMEGGTSAGEGDRPVRRPTLLIGLGGIGTEVLTRVKANHLWRDGRVPDSLAFLAIDADDHLPTLDLEPGDEETSCRLDPHDEFYRLSLIAPRSLVDSSPDEFAWCPDNIPPAAIQNGTGAVRLSGRLALHAHAREVFQRIQRIHDRLLSVRRTGTEPEIDILVIASLAGGTGAGTFLDLGIYCSHQLPHVRSVRAVLVGPRVLEDMGATHRTSANAYASLIELDHLLSPETALADEAPGETGWRLVTGLEGEGLRCPPFDSVYLCDGINLDGRRLGTRTNVVRCVADGVGELVADGNPAPGGLYASFGVASLVVPEEQHSALARLAYSRRLLKRTLDEPPPDHPIQGRITEAAELIDRRFADADLNARKGLSDHEIAMAFPGEEEPDAGETLVEDARALLTSLLLEDHRGESGPEELLDRVDELANHHVEGNRRAGGHVLGAIETHARRIGDGVPPDVPVKKVFELAAPLVCFGVEPVILARREGWMTETRLVSADPESARALLGEDGGLAPEQPRWRTHDDPTRLSVLRICAGFDPWSLADLDRWREKYERIELPPLHTSRYFERVGAGRSSARSG